MADPGIKSQSHFQTPCKFLNEYIDQKQVEFDRPGERSPEEDCCC